MIKNFKQFNEELSPELLKRAAGSSYDRGQEVRGNKFYRASEEAVVKDKNSKKRANYEEFMSITGGIIFGFECIVDELRVNPGGDTWIEIRGDFKTKKGNATRIFITDDLIKENKILIVGGGRTEETINLNEIVIERRDARVYSNFLNWWKGEQRPFSVDDYCIRGIHL